MNRSRLGIGGPGGIGVGKGQTLQVEAIGRGVMTIGRRVAAGGTRTTPNERGERNFERKSLQPTPHQTPWRVPIPEG